MAKFHHGPNKDHVRMVLARRKAIGFSPAWEGPHEKSDPGFGERMAQIFRLGRGQR
jgi:hypothetical protein